MSIIEGASVSARTMADGTLRLSIDIEPRNAQDAFALFGAPGRAVALAALKDGAGAVVDHAVTSKPVVDHQKGGEWAKLAGMWSADPDFHQWVNSTTHNGIYWDIQNDFDAAGFIREICDIRSRAELDHNAEALAAFNELIRFPFMKWMQARGIRK